MAFFRGVAVPGFGFGLLNTSGGIVNSGVTNGFVIKDGGSQNPLTNTPIYKGHGTWTVDLTSPEMDAVEVVLTFENALALTKVIPISTVPLTSATIPQVSPGITGPAVFLSKWFCTDEDVLLLVGAGDYAVLADRGQKLAVGSDGVISAGSWVLTSSSKNFSSQGVLPGDVVFLSGTKGSAAGNLFGPPLAPGLLGGTEYAIDAVSGGTLTLRMPGGDPLAGEPPGPAGGITNVSFGISTLRPQIKEVSDWVRDQIDWDAAADLISSDDLNQQAALRTAAWRYRAQVRLATMAGGVQGGAGASGDVFAVKSKWFQDDADRHLDRLQSRRRSLDAVDSLEVVPRDH
jgi:hypothetical protein